MWLIWLVFEAAAVELIWLLPAAELTFASPESLMVHLQNVVMDIFVCSSGNGGGHGMSSFLSFWMCVFFLCMSVQISPHRQREGRTNNSEEN